MTEQQAYRQRVMIEVSTSVKGVHTYSSTVEILDVDKEVVLAESDALVKALDARYPAPLEESKREKGG